MAPDAKPKRKVAFIIGLQDDPVCSAAKSTLEEDHLTKHGIHKIFDEDLRLTTTGTYKLFINTPLYSDDLVLPWRRWDEQYTTALRGTYNPNNMRNMTLSYFGAPIALFRYNEFFVQDGKTTFETFVRDLTNLYPTVRIHDLNFRTQCVGCSTPQEVETESNDELEEETVQKVARVIRTLCFKDDPARENPAWLSHYETGSVIDVRDIPVEDNGVTQGVEGGEVDIAPEREPDEFLKGKPSASPEKEEMSDTTKKQKLITTSESEGGLGERQIDTPSESEPRLGDLDLDEFMGRYGWGGMS